VQPIALEGEQKIYTREALAGLAHDSELNPFKKGEKPVSQLEKWEIAEKAADWMKVIMRVHSYACTDVCLVKTAHMKKHAHAHSHAHTNMRTLYVSKLAQAAALEFRIQGLAWM
jgi:hypothetical protein